MIPNPGTAAVLCAGSTGVRFQILSASLELQLLYKCVINVYIVISDMSPPKLAVDVLFVWICWIFMDICLDVLL